MGEDNDRKNRGRMIRVGPFFVPAAGHMLRDGVSVDALRPRPSAVDLRWEQIATPIEPTGASRMISGVATGAD